LSIELELIEHLEGATPAGPQQARNIRIVLYFYGLGSARWPTLEETAEAFGLGTRERVRQILGGAVATLSGARRLPTLRATSRLIRSRPFWVASELAAKIAERTGDSPDLSPRGLLSLMQMLGLARSYETYDHDLQPLTRSQLAAGGDYVLVRKDAVGALQWGLIAARRLSLRLGIISTARLGEILGAEGPVAEVKALLAIDPACWTRSEGEDVWCALETPDNVLVALTAKAFAAAAEAAPGRLAETLCNALNARVGRERHAGGAQVEAWIQTSRWFRRRDGRVVFLGEPAELSPVERELVDYLSARAAADYPAIKAHLRSRGVLASMIAKTATQSPVVHIDRSGGMRSYRYSLVGRSRAGASDDRREDVAGSRSGPPALH
jgi:hypothetical protein